MMDSLLPSLGLTPLPPRRQREVKMTSLFDLSARCLALHAHQLPRDAFASIAELPLHEQVQRYMGRLRQIDLFREYRTFYRDGLPELLEHYDEEGRKHGRCVYWRETGRVESVLKYSHGLPHGSQKYYDHRGVLTQQLRYKDGKFKEEYFIEGRTYSPFNVLSPLPTTADSVSATASPAPSSSIISRRRTEEPHSQTPPATFASMLSHGLMALAHPIAYATSSSSLHSLSSSSSASSSAAPSPLPSRALPTVISSCATENARRRIPESVHRQTFSLK